MAYTKTQWVNNQTPALDAEHLNHIEQGIKDAHDGLDGKADAADIPTKVSDLTNDEGYTSNTGTITGITMNGASKGTSGNVDLGTVLTQHQDISGKQDTLVSGTNIKTINGSTLLGPGNIVIEGGGGGGTENIAAEYSTSSTYAVGDYCLYDGDLYRCTTAITTAEAWTAAHWTMATVGGELTDLKGDIAVKVAAKDRTGTLTTSGWSNKSQTIAVVGLDPEDTAIVSIDSSDASGYEAARDSDIRLTGRANGTLTFSCEDVPTSNIGVVITILE